MENFYILKQQQHPWGDYSNILIHGMSAHLGRDGGLIQLERTGPFIPPMTLPGIGDIVVTEAFRKKLEASGLEGLRFQPVIKKHIARSDWHTWDKATKRPKEHPHNGEPEGYILDEPHSVSTAMEMGELWELLLNRSAKIFRVKDPGALLPQIFLLPESWQGEDLFRPENGGKIFATERAKDWLEANTGEFVQLEPAKIKDK